MASPAPAPDSTAHQIKTIEELKVRLASGKKLRTDAVHRLQKCAEEVAQDTPADSSCFRIARYSDDEEGSGIRKLPELERVAARRAQLVEGRKKGREVLAQLKATSLRVVQGLSPTRYLDPEEVQRRLADGSLTASSQEAAKLNGNGSGSDHGAVST